MPNQAALRRWHTLVNAPDWQQYLNALYQVVNYWQGEYLMTTGIFFDMKTAYFGSADGINQYLAINNPITDPAVITAIYTDPNYGLENYQNYAVWNALQETHASTAAVNKKLAFQAELLTYWGLSTDQVNEITTNWNSLFNTVYGTWTHSIPSYSTYENA